MFGFFWWDFTFLIVLPGFLLALWAQARVRSAYRLGSSQHLRPMMTGANVARRILDFLSGVAYANDGQIKKVANCTYIITPYNVGFMGDLLDELENNGVYF